MDEDTADLLWALFSVIGGLCWTTTYVIIIVKSFRNKDKLYMPLLGLACNIIWEIFYTFIITVSLVQRIVDCIWFIFDVLIVIFSVRNYILIKKTSQSMSYSIFYLLGCLVAGIYVNLMFVAFTPDDPGTYSAYVINIYLSYLYLFEKDHQLNIPIAFLKMMGTAIYCIFAYFVITSSPFMTLTYCLLFILDLCYFIKTLFNWYLLNNNLKEKNSLDDEENDTNLKEFTVQDE